MKPVQKILVPIDFSTHTTRVLQLAAELSRRHEASVTLLHVWEPELISVPGSFQLYDPRSLPHGLDHLTQKLEDSRDRLRGDGVLIVDLAVAHGAPAGEIVRCAEAGSYDLIVIGTHGRTGLARALLGSVAEKVMRKAACPVMTVHLEGHTLHHQPSHRDSTR